MDPLTFENALLVTTGLRARDYSEALRWCAKNTLDLAKASSTLEFQLHRQMFIEYARGGQQERAIKYARQLLMKNTISVERRHEIDNVMGLLVFPADTHYQPYKHRRTSPAGGSFGRAEEADHLSRWPTGLAWAAERVPELHDDQLGDVERILDAETPFVLKWVLGAEKPPSEMDTDPLIRRQCRQKQ